MWKNALNRLLLGINTQSLLGLFRLQKETEDSGLSLATGEKMSLLNEKVEQDQQTKSGVDSVLESEIISKNYEQWLSLMASNRDLVHMQQGPPGLDNSVSQECDREKTVPVGVVHLFNATRFPLGTKRWCKPRWKVIPINRCTCSPPCS